MGKRVSGDFEVQKLLFLNNDNELVVEYERLQTKQPL